MVKDDKKLKIALLAIVAILAFIPGIGRFFNREDPMKNAGEIGIETIYQGKTTVSVHSISGNIEASFSPSVDGVKVIAESARVTEGNDGQLSIRSISGDIELVFGDDTFREIRLSSTSGNVGAENLATGLVELSSTSGDILATGIAADNLALSSLSGNVVAAFIKAAEGIFYSTTSGNLELRDSAADSVTISSISGKSALESTTASSFRIDTTSGDTEIDVDGNDYHIEFECGTGKIETGYGTFRGKGTYGNEESPVQIKFKSATGYLEIR